MKKSKLIPPDRKQFAALPVVRAVLVYQAGIANVFQVDNFCWSAIGRSERRLFQHCFRSCEDFARGLGAAGVIVSTMACNKAGDIARQDWSTNLDEQPFSEQFHPVFIGVEQPVPAA